jgi:hypothetical protein
MGAVGEGIKADRGKPGCKQASVLPRRHPFCAPISCS